MYAPLSFIQCLSDSDLTSLAKGGRLVAERRMVTDIYMFDIETFTWEKIPQAPDPDQPRARYFHSTDACEFQTLALRLSLQLTATGFRPSRILERQGITI